MTNENENVCSDQIYLMVERGEHHFDEPRFRYISSMYDRAVKQRAPVLLRITKKVQVLLTGYRLDLGLASEKSQALARRIKMSFPDSFTEVDILVKYYDYKGLMKLEERLIRTVGDSALKTLTNLLLQDARDNDGEPTLLDRLERQENEEVEAFTRCESKNELNKTELKSSRLFKESQDKLNAEKLIRQAIQQGPDNPGPINPHMLAIRSLSTMQSLSPQYLKRFLSYIDTVFWLEHANEALKPKVTTKRHVKPHTK
jgi:hypothetical protein